MPDSSWFTNRIGRQQMPVADVARGPDRVERVSLDGWVVSGGKSGGVQPGFRMTDPSGQLYQIEVDPPSNPELASGAEIIGTAFYHAIGYHAVEVYLAELDRAALVISDKATIRDPLNGKRRPLKKSDLDDVFDRAARLAERPLPRARQPLRARQAARQLPLLRHASRRSERHRPARAPARAARRARVRRLAQSRRLARHQQPRHARDRRTGARWVKHYMFDFGSILGSGTVYAQRHRPGNEYIFEQRPGWLTLATLGLYIRPWMLIDYPDVPPSVGRLEAKAFDPLEMEAGVSQPRVRQHAAGRCVLGRADRGEVHRRDDPRGRARRRSTPIRRATDYMTQTLIARRDKVVAAWLNQVCPVVDPALAADGALTFANAAVAARRRDAGRELHAADGSASTTPPTRERRSGIRSPLTACRRAPRPD